MTPRVLHLTTLILMLDVQNVPTVMRVDNCTVSPAQSTHRT